MRTERTPSPRGLLHLTLVLLLPLVLVGSTRAAHAQADHRDPFQTWETTRLTGEFAYLGFNTLVGAATAGVIAKVRGKDVSEAVLVGAMGGAVVYAGKRTAVMRFAGAGLLGRQVAGVGSSVVRNAGMGEGAWHRLTLPLPLLRVDIAPAERAVTGARLNLTELATLAYLVTRDAVVVEWGASLSSGAPVLEARYRRIRSGDDHSSGIHASGVVLIGGIRRRPYEDVLAHERVHVLQRDFAGTAWTLPVEDWLLGKVPGADRWTRWVDVDLLSQATSFLTGPAIEGEAYFLDGR